MQDKFDYINTYVRTCNYMLVKAGRFSSGHPLGSDIGVGVGSRL